MQCPRCQSEPIVKNGTAHNGKPKYMYRDCQRQFVEHPESRRISDETKALIDNRLLERLSLAGIARVTGVAERWLQTYGNEQYAEQPRQVQVRPKKKGA